jgi:hypothetical protein
MSAPTPYNPSVPLISESFADWQLGIYNNFTQLNNIFSVNHEPLTAASNLGNHTVVQLFNQDSSLQTNINQVGLFGFTTPNQTAQLYYQQELNGGGNNPIPITNYQIYPLQALGTQTQSFTMLPGNVIVYYGVITLNPTNSSLLLNPQITKNLISVLFTRINSTIGVGSPTISFLPVVEENKIVTKLDLWQQTDTPITGSWYYLAFGNT